MTTDVETYKRSTMFSLGLFVRFLQKLHGTCDIHPYDQLRIAINLHDLLAEDVKPVR